MNKKAYKRNSKIKKSYDTKWHLLFFKGEDVMKRNMDLARKILLTIEDKGNPGISNEELLPLIKDYDNTEIYYHIELLQQVGFINVKGTIKIDYPFQITGITWTGYEFIEAARDNGRWEKAKKIVIEKSGSMVVEYLFKTLMLLVGQQMGMK